MNFNYFLDKKDPALEAFRVFEKLSLKDPFTNEYEKHTVSVPFRLVHKADIMWRTVKLKTRVLPVLGRHTAKYIWEYLKDPESDEKTLESIPAERARIMKKNADKFIALLCSQKFVCGYLHFRTPIGDLKSFRDWYVNSATKLNSSDLVRAVKR